MNPIEQEVREMLRTKVEQAPVRDEPPPVVLRRTRVIRGVNGVSMAAAAAAVVLGVVLGAQTFGDRVVEPDTTTDRIPWIEAREPEPERPLPVCRSSQVAVSARSGITGGFLDFTLKGDQPCRLSPPAAIELRDAQGQEFPYVSTLVVPNIYLDPGVRASFAVASMNSCGPSMLELTYVVRLEGGATTVEPDPAAVRASGAPTRPACTDESPGDFHLLGMQPVAAEAPSVPAGLEYSMVVPTSVPRGATLHYEVTIANPTPRDIALSPCPIYRQLLLLYEDGHAADHHDQLQLNCAGAEGMIRARDRVTFEMKMVVPARRGNWLLVWGVDDVNSIMTARVRVL